MSVGNLFIVVKDAQTSEIIPNYKFLVNLDNVGDPQFELPENQRNPNLFPSIKPGASYSPLVVDSVGNSITPTSVILPANKYIVSIMSDGYKIGGGWVNLVAGATEQLEVELQPHPLPLAKLRVHVFHDNQPVNGQDDIPLESGLEGFRVIIEDPIGEVTVDYFGNPLGTKYETDSVGKVLLDVDGNPTPVPNTGGVVLSDQNGNVVIENLPPGKYGVQVIPPDETDWVQTTTIEGTRTIDAWIEEGNNGYYTSEGFKVALVWVGFVQPKEFPVGNPLETSSVEGRILSLIEFAPPTQPVEFGGPVERPWIALSDIGGNDQQVYTGRGNIDGTFFIEHVPPGVYQMAIWDEPLDYIISFRTVIVEAGSTLDMGDIGIPRWYGVIEGKVFLDLDQDGTFDPGEKGIPNVEIVTRFKDGTIQYTTVTNPDGNYTLKEVFPLGRFVVAEVGFARFGFTGGTGTPNYIPTSLTNNSETFPNALTVAELTWANSTNKIDWGKKLYSQGENGGISGVVYYAAMRNELDPRFSAVEDYEPGIPNVRLSLYEAIEQNGGFVQGNFVTSTTTDAWDHPTGCTDINGLPIDCVEVPNSGTQIREGLFDGGFAFDGLAPGNYIVKIILPPAYKVLDVDGSTNTEDGDEFVPPENLPRVLPAPYFESSPGQINRYKKVVKVIPGMNAACDFFLYTDVPAPGRMVGFLTDDVNIETDPNLLYFGEKRGLPYIPIGFRDFTGKLIKTVYTDINGVFEVLLPSTYTRNIPTPAGVAPGMYQVIGNDPGIPEKPNIGFNPNYQTLPLVFDVWPGKTTIADVAIFPITSFVENQGIQFANPPLCDTPNTPQVFTLSTIQANINHQNDDRRTFKIFGKNFGTTSGKVTLNGVEITILAWSEEEITVMVPRRFVVTGPAQLLVTNTSGVSSHSGLTFHLRRRGRYWPRFIVVNQDGTGDFTTVQEAINNADGGNIVAVAPGIYYENIILNKNIKLQGLGPGGVRNDGTAVIGSVLDGRFISTTIDQWLDRLSSIEFDGAQNGPLDQVQNIIKGQVVTVVAKSGVLSNTFRTQIDGFYISSGRAIDGGGLGIYAHAHCNNLIISNNVLRSNGGGFGGALQLGSPYVGDNYNDNISIYHNRILNNGGMSLAGGVGIYNGADNYDFHHNHVCGNYSAEYGGGVSHFGYSDGGKIHHNIIEFNSSFDEGGGIFIGGEQPIPPQILTNGSGRVDIYNNLIRGNLGNDDGGGIRLLQPREYKIRIFNNMIVNNISTDLGGGIALDDASDVEIINNTIAKNITTATAEDSDGQPRAAGLVSEGHSAAFLSFLPPGEVPFSNPVLFNNIFWDNRAGTFDITQNGGLGGIIGIGAFGDPINTVDLEVLGTPSTEYFNPQYCLLSVPYPNGSNNIVGSPPEFVDEYDLEITAIALKGEPDFKNIKIKITTPDTFGDYHLSFSSTCINNGASLVGGVSAPGNDYDNEARPVNGSYDIGADEYV